MTNKRLFLSIILLIFCLLAVFLSVQSNNSSNELTNNLLRSILKNEIKDTESLEILVQANAYIFRKMLHFTLFSIATIPLFLLINTYSEEQVKTSLITLIVVFIFATSDEFRQILFSDREFRVKDIFIDTMGGAFTIIAINSLIIIRRGFRGLKRSSGTQIKD